MMPKNRQVNGIDLGCGAHFFTNYTRKAYDWNTIGLDQWAEAIEYGRFKYPDSAEAYWACDFLRGIPFKDATMDFVFSNVVIQHFDDGELDKTFAEVSRVLRGGGIFLVIFKRWTDWARFTEETGLKVNILSRLSGVVEIEEPQLKKAIAAAPLEITQKLTLRQREGMREFRWFENQEVVYFGRRHGLHLVALVEFTSGRGLPASAIMFERL